MMVEVTQEDCVAAARHTTGPFRNTFLEEAFARHRIAAEQRGKLEGARLALEAAGDYVAHWAEHTWPTSTEGEAKAIIRCIRALDPAKIVGEG